MSDAKKLVVGKGILPPPVVEIEGVEYPLKRLTRDNFAKLAAIEKEVRSGNATAVFDQIPLILDVPPEVCANLTFVDVRQIVDFVMRSLYAPLSTLTEEEKNVPAPGSKKPA